VTLRFITGNKNKFEEVKSILDNVELKQLNIDLPEIQDIDAHKIIRKKLTSALKHKKGEFIVEDTSLYIDCLNGLPGPLIKWFLQTIGNGGLYEIAKNMGREAEAKTIIGYARSEKEIYFFEGTVSGKIVEPKGDSNFGWDPIFQPERFSESFAEMSKEQKNKISMRRKALEKLKVFLEKD